MKIIKVREINMRGIKEKKTGGMNLKKPKISLILIFTIILSIFIGLYSPKKADAAVANINQWSATAVFDAATNPSTGTAYSYAAGSNRIVVVAVEYETSAIAAHTVAVTYGGTALTQILNNVTQRQNIWIGYIKEASLPASGSNIVSTITLGGTATLTRQTIHAATYSGVDQTAPIVASNAQASASAANLTYTSINVTNGGYIFYDWNFNTTTAGAQDSNNGTGYTEHFDQLYTTYNLSLASKPITATGTETVTVTTALVASRCALSVVSLNPAATGDSVNVADGTDPANANAGRGSVNNVADSFTMVSTNIQNGLAAVTGVTASFTNSANISGVRLYKDNGVAGTYEAGTDTLMSTGTPGASVNFTGFTENLTISATNYLILVDIASGATLTQIIDTSVTALTVTAPDAQGTISDASNPTRLTIIDSPHEDAATALNTAIATTPILEATSGVLMQRFQVSSSTSGSGAQDDQLELNSLGIDDLGTATGARTAKVYIDTTSSATLPGTAVLIGTLSSWTGAPTTITLNQGTSGDRTVANATSKYIYIVYDLPGGATQTVQSSITSVGVVSPDAGQTGLTLNSNSITLSADPSQITSCGGCHGYGATLTDGTARNVPAGKFQGSHNKHVNTYGKTCSVCHVAPATEINADFKHRNGMIEIASPINGNSGAAYTKGASWTQTNAAFSGGTCSNTYCHSSGVGVLSATIPSNTSTAWGGTPDCGNCHGTVGVDDGRPNYTNNSLKRNTHGNATYGVTHKATACPTCHAGISGSAGAYTVSPTTHNNGAYDLSATFGYTQAAGTCATPGCHGSAIWGTSLGCVDCHASAQGTRSIITGASGEFGLAWGHKKSGRGTVTDADCIVCHLEGAYTAGVGSAVAKTAYHSGAPNGNIDLRDPDGAGETPITNNSGGAFTFTKYSISYAAGSRTTTLGNSIPEVITVKFCMKCHDSNGATNTTARSNNGGTGIAAQPFGGISTGYSLINGAAAVNGLIDVSTQFAAANSSRHPVGAPNSRMYPYSTRLASPYNNIGTARDANTQVGNTASPRAAANSVVLVCDDCHTVTTAAGSLPSLTNRTITAHGTAQTENVRGTFMVATPVLCLSCHGGTTTPNTTTAQIDTTNGDHNPGSAFAVGTTRVNAFIANCGYCHFSALTTPVRPIKAQDIHGFNGMQTTGAAWAWGTVSGMRPVAFMRNVANFATASPRPYTATIAGPGQFNLAGGQSSCAGTGDLTNASCSGQTGKHTPYSPGGSY